MLLRLLDNHIFFHRDQNISSPIDDDEMEIELVFIPSPGIGHIRSTVAIAKLLVDCDERLFVTLVVIPSQFSNDDVSSSFSQVASSKNRLRYYRLSAGDQPIDHPEQSHISYIESRKPHVRAAVSEISTRSSDSQRRIAGIVVDMFCTSMIEVADELNLPVYAFYTSNASYLGLQFHIQSHYDEKTKLYLSESSYFDVPTLTRPFPVNCLPSIMLSKEWFPYVLARAKSLRGTKGILVNAVAEMEPYALKFFSGENRNNTPPVYAVGPVLDLGDNDSGDDEKRREILRWLDEQPPSSVLFLCFGSMGGFSEEQAREIAVALERSGHRFLWSLRRARVFSAKNVNGSPPGEFTNLEEILPEGFSDRTAEIGKIISWAPQVAVLENPAVGGFVTHCGWNSILESLWFGVPTAAWPIFAEQQFNAFQIVEELGLAAEVQKDYRRDFLVVEPELVTAEKIERAINRVMEQGSDMRKKVKEMRDKFRVALLDGGSSRSALRRFVQDVVDNI